MYLTLTLGWPRSRALALALVCGPSAALAQVPAKDTLTFPPSLEHGVLTDWLKRETDIPPGAVVAISPLAVVAIMQTRPMASPEGFEVSVRAETIDAGFSRQEGIASWNATMKLACTDRTFSMGEVTAHTARNLKGETKPIQTALAGWNPVTLGTMQGQIWSARCGGDFKPPLAEPPMPVAVAPPAATPAVAKPARPASAPAPSPTVTSTAPAAKPLAAPVATPAVATPAKPAPAPTLPPAPAVTPTAPAAKPLAAPMPPVATPPKSEPTPPPAATPKPAPAPSPPVAKPPPPKPPASSAKPAGPSRPSSAQILSAPSSEEAARALTKLKSRLGNEMSGLSTSVVTVQTDGKTRYRAIVAGFQTPGDAMRFCEKVTAAGGKCLARNDAGRAASEKPAP